MKKGFHRKSDGYADSRGVGTVEIIIVLVLIGILAALAIPQLLGARRLMRFTNIQQQITAELREARQLAISRRRRVTVQYDDTGKLIRTFDVPVPTPTPVSSPPPSPTPTPLPTPIIVDVFGIEGDAKNRIAMLTDSGLLASDIVYGAPPAVPVAATTLGDTSTLTSLNPGVGGVVNITFNPRGDVVVPTTGAIDSNKALFFYESNSNTTFAISILAPGGRIKIWRYNGTSYE